MLVSNSSLQTQGKTQYDLSTSPGIRRVSVFGFGPLVLWVSTSKFQMKDDQSGHSNFV